MSTLFMDISEDTKFKILLEVITCVFSYYMCVQYVVSHLIYLPDPGLSHAAPVYIGIIPASCCSFPGTVFSARSDSLEISWCVYFPRHNYRLLAVLAIHPYIQTCVMQILTVTQITLPCFMPICISWQLQKKRSNLETSSNQHLCCEPTLPPSPIRSLRGVQLLVQMLLVGPCTDWNSSFAFII